MNRTPVHTLLTVSAILDLHFSPYQPDFFAIATSTGSLSLYKLSIPPASRNPSAASRPHLVHYGTFQLFPSSTLVLSLAWHPSHPQLIGCTLSTGTVALVTLAADFSNATIARSDLSRHGGLEAWTLCFTPPAPTVKSMPQTCYSGGDDSKLRALSFPSLGSLSHPVSEIQSRSPGGNAGMKGHDAGVTAILALPLGTTAGEDILLTGSYDDHVRVFAVKDWRENNNGRPKVICEKNLGGGVWRLKMLDRESEKVLEGDRVFKVLASCMHAGPRILELSGNKYGEWKIEIVGRFEEHGSMNYGSDVQPVRKKDWRGLQKEDLGEMNERNQPRSVVSTSFYDRRLCVWKIGAETERTQATRYE